MSMERKKIAWRDQAKAQLRAIDQPTALRLLRYFSRHQTQRDRPVLVGPGSLGRQHYRSGARRSAEATTAVTGEPAVLRAAARASATVIAPFAVATNDRQYGLAVGQPSDRRDATHTAPLRLHK